jgi:hypothetical protein
MDAVAIPDTRPAPPIDDVESELMQLAAHLHAGQYRWLQLLVAFDEAKGWERDGFCSFADWAGVRVGLGHRAARERLRVARALTRLPRISESMAQGHLSYWKVRELTRVATAENEADLLEMARSGTAEDVERAVRCFRQSVEAQELDRERLQQARRGVSVHVEEDGSYVVRARLPADAGALVMKVLDAATEEIESAESWSVRRADAFARVAQGYLAGGRGKDLTGADRHQVVVHVDLETLCEGVPGQCQIEDGPSLAAETARRFACDSEITTVLQEEDGKVVRVGRRTRTISAAVRRAIHLRDPHCSYPGCRRDLYTDLHHVVHWARGGESTPSNLTRLCSVHHRAVHEGGFRIVRGETGALQFVTPDGRVVDGTPGPVMRGDWRELAGLQPH